MDESQQMMPKWQYCLVTSISINDQMPKTRELVNAHLYPILASFSVIYFAIQIAPVAERARKFNDCVETIKTETGQTMKGVGAVAFCNGARFADAVILEQ